MNTKTRKKKLEKMYEALIREEPSPIGNLLGGFVSILMGVQLMNVALQVTTQSLQSAGLPNIQENKPRNFLYTI